MIWLRHPDRLAGLLFALCGATFALGAGAYDMGNAGQMGPGYFPRLLGGLLVVLGIAILASAKNAAAPASSGGLPWRPILAVSAGVGAFGFLLQPLGLFLASALLVVLSSLGQRALRWREILASAGILALAACLVFAWGLNLPLAVWPAFI